MWQAPWTLWPLLSSSVSHVNGQWLWRTQAWEIKAREDHLEKQMKPSHSGGSGINWISRQIQCDKGRPSGRGGCALITMLSCITLLYNFPVKVDLGSQHGSTILSPLKGDLGNVPETLALADGKVFQNRLKGVVAY